MYKCLCFILCNEISLSLCHLPFPSARCWITTTKKASLHHEKKKKKKINDSSIYIPFPYCARTHAHDYTEETHADTREKRKRDFVCRVSGAKKR